MASPTYRDIARLAGCSVASVSAALRNRPGVSEATRKQIQSVAKAAGYKPNPLVMALMADHRRGSTRRTRAIIACISSSSTVVMEARHSSSQEYIAGARAACEEAGFLFERLTWEDFGESPRRLFASLRTRRVTGVILNGEAPEWCREGWDDYALASLGNRPRILPCHFACADHFRDTLVCLRHLVDLGYKRIGFAMMRQEWLVRNENRALSAYVGWRLQSRMPLPQPYWSEKWNEKSFLEWVRKQAPEVVVIAQHAFLEALGGAGYRIPEEIGIAHLDLDLHWPDLSGIRQNNFEAGQATTHLVIDQINHNTYGIPAHSRSVLITGTWFEGATVKRLR